MLLNGAARGAAIVGEGREVPSLNRIIQLLTEAISMVNIPDNKHR